MGGSAERRMDGGAAGPTPARTSTPSPRLRRGPEASIAPPVPGLPDASSERRPLTKAEVRAATWRRSVPGRGRSCGMWGQAPAPSASNGSIRAPRPRVIEPVAGAAPSPENAEALGCPCSDVEGRAPYALEGLPAPDAVFIGGGFRPGLVALLGGLLRGAAGANVVTLEGNGAGAALTGLGERWPDTCGAAGEGGPYRGWRSLMGVTRWRAVKPLGDGA